MSNRSVIVPKDGVSRMAKLFFITNGFYVYDYETQRFAYSNGTSLKLSPSHGTLYPNMKVAKLVAEKLGLEKYGIEYTFGTMKG